MLIVCLKRVKHFRHFEGPHLESSYQFGSSEWSSQLSTSFGSIHNLVVALVLMTLYISKLQTHSSSCLHTETACSMQFQRTHNNNHCCKQHIDAVGPIWTGRWHVWHRSSLNDGKIGLSSGKLGAQGPKKKRKKERKKALNCNCNYPGFEIKDSFWQWKIWLTNHTWSVGTIYFFLNIWVQSPKIWIQWISGTKKTTETHDIMFVWIWMNRGDSHKIRQVFQIWLWSKNNCWNVGSKLFNALQCTSMYLVYKKKNKYFVLKKFRVSRSVWKGWHRTSTSRFHLINCSCRKMS